MPNESELQRLAQMCEAPAIQLFKRNKHLGEVDLVKLIQSNPNNGYTKEDVVHGADLIKKCLKWVPADRI